MPASANHSCCRSRRDPVESPSASRPRWTVRSSRREGGRCSTACDGSAAAAVAAVAVAVRRPRGAAALRQRRAATTTARTRCDPPGQHARQDPRPVHAVLLDRGRHRHRRRRRRRSSSRCGSARSRAKNEPGADARQHRARDQLDDHPGADPRGHGRASTVADDLRPRQDARRAPTSSTSTVVGQQWCWEYAVHRRRTASTPRTRCTSRSTGRWCSTLTSRQRASTRSGCPSSRARRTSCRADAST